MLSMVDMVLLGRSTIELGTIELSTIMIGERG